MPFRDILLAAAVPVLWGVGFTLAKPAVGHFPPLLMMAIAYVATAAVLVPRAGAFRTPWWALALIAALAATLQGGLIFNGLRELPASTATLVLQLQVPFAVLCAWLLGRDRPDPRRLLGIALAFAGVALVAGSPSAAAVLPILLVALGSLSWAAGQAVAQVTGKDEGRTLFAGIAAHAVPQLVVASAVLERGQLAALRTAGALDWAAMLGLALCGFVLAYSLWYGLLRRYRMDQVAPFALLMPAVGVALGALLLGERPSTLELAGGALIVAGLGLVVLRPGDRGTLPHPIARR
jgi:O-acetylserine/cysteine efflux transporter